MKQPAPLCLAFAVSLSLALALTVARLGEAGGEDVSAGSRTRSALELSKALDEVILEYLVEKARSSRKKG